MVQPAAGWTAQAGDLPALRLAIAGQNDPDEATSSRVSEHQPVIRPAGLRHGDLGDLVAGDSSDA